MQTSTEGEQTVEGKQNFESLAENCALVINNYHVDNKIFNNQLFKGH